MMNMYPKYYYHGDFESKSYGDAHLLSLRSVVPSLATLLLGAIFVAVPRFVDTAIGEMLGLAVVFLGLIVLFVTSVILSRPIVSIGGFTGVVIAILGGLFLLNPKYALVLAGSLTGVGLIFQGVMEFRLRAASPAANFARFLAALGVLSVIGGTLLLVFPLLTLSALTMAVGVWIIVASTLRISYGMWMNLRSR
jgi:hypothetical protein